MSENYRGDTFWRAYCVKLDKKPYMFNAGDFIRVAFCNKGKKYLEKTININLEQEKINVEWSKDEMASLPNSEYILECEITTPIFRKTYQEKIYIQEDNIK